MKKTILLACLALLSSCNGPEHKNKYSHENGATTEEKHHADHEDQKEHTPGSANEFMHQSPIEELVERFESPERDAYQKPEKVLDYLGDLNGKTVMDIGAGSGYFSVKLAKKGAEVIAADVDDGFQAFLKDRIEKEQLQNLTTRKIPYDSPGLEASEVDIVLIVNTYHHIENRSEYFAKVKAGIKKNGKLVIIDFFDADIPVGPKHHKISIDTVVSELKGAGYTQFEVNVSLLPYQYIITAN